MASFTLTRDVWTDLGPGPFRLFVTDVVDAAIIVISDTMPAAGAVGVRVNGFYWQGFPVNASATHVWARASISQVTASTVVLGTG